MTSASVDAATLAPMLSPAAGFLDWAFAAAVFLAGVAFLAAVDLVARAFGSAAFLAAADFFAAAVLVVAAAFLTGAFFTAAFLAGTAFFAGAQHLSQQPASSPRPSWPTTSSRPRRGAVAWVTVSHINQGSASVAA